MEMSQTDGSLQMTFCRAKKDNSKIYYAVNLLFIKIHQFCTELETAIKMKVF